MYLPKLLSVIPSFLISNLIWMYIIATNPDTIKSFEGHVGFMGYIISYFLGGMYYVFFVVVLVLPLSFLLHFTFIKINKYNFFANILIHIVVFGLILVWTTVYLRDTEDLLMFSSVACIYTVVSVCSEVIIRKKYANNYN